jgi:ABC-type multidrug transport system ATPase subunit
MDKIIEIQNLVKQFNGFAAVDGLTFSVGKGEFFGLLGPNGAGKTTTIRMLYG